MATNMNDIWRKSEVTKPEWNNYKNWLTREQLHEIIDNILDEHLDNFFFRSNFWRSL